jgi:hypothetical protein
MMFMIDLYSYPALLHEHLGAFLLDLTKDWNHGERRLPRPGRNGVSHGQPFEEQGRKPSPSVGSRSIPAPGSSMPTACRSPACLRRANWSANFLFQLSGRHWPDELGPSSAGSLARRLGSEQRRSGEAQKPRSTDNFAVTAYG